MKHYIQRGRNKTTILACATTLSLSMSAAHATTIPDSVTTTPLTISVSTVAAPKLILKSMVSSLPKTVNDGTVLGIASSEATTYVSASTLGLMFDSPTTDACHFLAHNADKVLKIKIVSGVPQGEVCTEHGSGNHTAFDQTIAADSTQVTTPGEYKYTIRSTRYM